MYPPRIGDTSAGVHPIRTLFRPIERAVLGGMMTLVAVVLERRLRVRQR
jgi:hypothetical protein